MAINFSLSLFQRALFRCEVVKTALTAIAANVIFVHNHPSGASEPSRTDELLASELKAAMALIDVKVPDYRVIAGSEALSFVERGLL